MKLALSTVGGLLLTGLVIGSLGPPYPPATESRTIYVTSLDRDGRPVTDLQAADFALKAGNKPLEVTRAEPAQGPCESRSLSPTLVPAASNRAWRISCRSCWAMPNSRSSP